MIAYLFIFVAILALYAWNARDIRKMNEENEILDRLKGIDRKKADADHVIIYRIVRVDLSPTRRRFSVEIVK